MTYYADLDDCLYHRGDLHADWWHTPLKSVGWLDPPEAFPTGPTPPGLLESLRAMLEVVAAEFESFRGLHNCGWCREEGVADTLLPGSHVNLIIPGDACVYAAPAGIEHYLTQHGYLPPAEFVAAVEACPTYGSPAYFDALINANDGHPAPYEARATRWARWAADRARTDLTREQRRARAFFEPVRPPRE
ncbi:MAG: hypothetical protein KDA24_11080 [Deltaproteobacteria bacterium]|nr:hypothetical protein [Deltaproteobacteria bacterium]